MAIIYRILNWLGGILAKRPEKEDIASLINRLFEEGKIIRAIKRKTREGISIQIITLQIDRKGEMDFNLLRSLNGAKLVLTYGDKEISCLIRIVSEGQTHVGCDLQADPKFDIFKGGVHIPSQITCITTDGVNYKIK